LPYILLAGFAATYVGMKVLQSTGNRTGDARPDAPAAYVSADGKRSYTIDERVLREYAAQRK
jgi:hypothetical protein